MKMSLLKQFPLEELKLIYQVLHRNLKHEPELWDAMMLEQLQMELMQQASHQGYDTSIHLEWERFLQNEPRRNPPQLRVLEGGLA